MHLWARCQFPVVAEYFKGVMSCSSVDALSELLSLFLMGGTLHSLRVDIILEANIGQITTARMVQIERKRNLFTKT